MSESSRPEPFRRVLGKSLLLILLSAVLGTGLLILSEFLPADPMDRNLARSADIFQATGKFPNLHTWCSSRLDNYSDAIMLLMSGTVSREKPAEYAMLAWHGDMGDLDPVQIFVKHYIDGEPYEKYVPYSRYWHGYGVIYRLLLQVFDYHRIRQLNLLLQVSLILLLCWEMYRAGARGRGMMLPLLITWAMLGPAVMGMNLEYSLGFYVSMLSSLAALVLFRKGRLREREEMVLLFSGICTAYWDVLTYPMAALGMPLAVIFCLDPDGNLPGALKHLLRLGFLWGLGYGLMWALKWAIGTALTGYNCFEDALATLLLRTSGEAYGETVTALDTVLSNVRYFFGTPFSWLFAAFLLGEAGLLALRMPREKAAFRALGMRLLPFVLIAAIPMVWCVVTKNHASIHFWLASKGLIVTVMALMCGLDQARRALTGSGAARREAAG